MAYRPNRGRGQQNYSLSSDNPTRSRQTDMMDMRSQPSDEGSTRSSRSGSIIGEEMHRLVTHISNLYLNEECSDVILVVEGQKFPAHKVILAARSIYFKAMFFGGMREVYEKSVELQETPVHAFRVLLEYIYTGRMQLKEMKTDLVFDILGLVHKYGFTELEHNVSEYLKEICKPDNVCNIFMASQMFVMRSLAISCLDFIDFHAEVIIKHATFKSLTADALEQIISRDSFCAPEVNIFKAVREWMDSNPSEQKYFAGLMTHIRLSLIKLDDLLNVIRPSGLLPSDRLLDAIDAQTKNRSSDLGFRGFKIHNVNIATPTYDFQIISGDNLKNVSDSETPVGGDRSALKHSINEKDQGIIIQLSRPYIINHIKFRLLDREKQSLCYFIEVSIDKLDWVRVIDHTKYLCRSTQNLYFNQKVVRFIRICGTSTTHSSSTFHISNFEAMFTTEPFEVDTATSILIPKHNVATIQNNAVVIEGVSRSRNALLNGDTINYDWDNGYTCHQLGSGSIVVQLPQPYMIDSMGLLLWDCDDRQYSYYIEVSPDQTKWHQIVEELEVSSWRRVQFEMQPVCYIRIVGTHNSANEVFHCVHFECPASEDYPIGTNPSAARQFAGIGDLQGIPMGNNQDQGIERIAIEQPD